VARSYRPLDRDQAFLLPPDMREWLSDDHLVWLVLDIVAGLDGALTPDASGVKGRYEHPWGGHQLISAVGSWRRRGCGRAVGRCIA
jgi:hypothetical protein